MEEMKKLLEDCECTGYMCPHEISGKHYVMIPEDVDDLIDLAVSKERERVLRGLDKLQKYTGGSSVEPKDIRVKLVDVTNLINTK